MCVCHQLPSSLGHAEENVCSAGRPVFTHCNAHHEDTAGAAAGGAAAVSDQHTLNWLCLCWELYFKCKKCPNFRAEGKAVCWGQVLRLLSLIDALVSQKACKSAALHLLPGSVSGDEQLADLFPLLLPLLVPPTDHSLQQQQCSEVVGTILQSLCDQVSSILRIKANVCDKPLQGKSKATIILISVFTRTFLWWCLHLVKTVCQSLNSWPMHFQGER